MQKTLLSSNIFTQVKVRLTCICILVLPSHLTDISNQPIVNWLCTSVVASSEHDSAGVSGVKGETTVLVSVSSGSVNVGISTVVVPWFSNSSIS